MWEPSIYDFTAGDSPVLVSMPHVGIFVPEEIAARFAGPARQLPDTDWYLDLLYDFLPDVGVSCIRANYSRFVVDLNRPPSGESLYPGQREMEICPTTLFDGTPIYRTGYQPDVGETTARVARYWVPYHQQIERELLRIVALHGYAVLWDAHSIKSAIPGLFDGILPDFNWGTASGDSCDSELSSALLSVVESGEQYSAVLNGRFKGGYITRHYGNPRQKIHAVQLELSQATYLADEESLTFDELKVETLREMLRKLMDVVLIWRG